MEVLESKVQLIQLIQENSEKTQSIINILYILWLGLKIRMKYLYNLRKFWTYG